MVAGTHYERIDDEGLHIRVGGESRVIGCDSIVLCAGQQPVNGLIADLKAAGRTPHVIGGAKLAAELDAQRAINEAYQVAAAL